MKSFIKAAALWAVILWAAPLASGFLGRAENADTAMDAVCIEACPSIRGDLVVYDGKRGGSRILDPEEYAVSAVLEEMPFLLDGEALKAQVIAARTYAARRLLSGPDESGAHITDDSSLYQTCLTPEQAAAVYGDNYESVLSAVRKAAEATKGEIILFEGYPAVAAFHAYSGGMTESAESVWGKAFPYLVPVTSDTYEALRRFTHAEISARIRAEYEDAGEFEGIEIISSTPSGTVLEARVCGLTLEGREISRILSLESAAFEVSDTGDAAEFTVKGSGHLCGMSMNGADIMSRSGSSYREILAHYYPETQVIKADFVK